MRQVYIDLGSNVGKTSFDYAAAHPEAEIFCFEANKEMCVKTLEMSFAARRTFSVMWAAAWTYDGTIDFFQSGAHEASTIVPGKVEPSHWPQIDYVSSTSVPCIDFSKWLINNFTIGDDIFLKMDIEGSEYALLEKMMQDRSIFLVRHLRCEWHQDRYPGISKEVHDSVRSRVSNLLSLEDWT